MRMDELGCTKHDAGWDCGGASKVVGFCNGPVCPQSPTAMRAMIGDRDIRIEVDGGINADTAKLALAAGADTLVAGSAIFSGTSDGWADHIAALRG